VRWEDGESGEEVAPGSEGARRVECRIERGWASATSVDKICARPGPARVQSRNAQRVHARSS
jgi:hypothetical protein